MMLLPALATIAAATSASALSSSTAGAKHLVVDISAHGFGHLAQTAAVLNALDQPTNDANNKHHHDIKLTIRSVADEATLRERIHRPFDLIPYRQDGGMIMHDALRVDTDATMDWYRDFHSTYHQRRSDAAGELEVLRPDLVFSNVPYLGLEAAKLVGVPSVALCSLNWADIFQSYCGNYEGASHIHDTIRNAYSNAEVFLRPTPSMPMESLDYTQPISPIAFVGKECRSRIRSIAGVREEDDNVKFVLIGLGGVGINNLPLDTWPRLDGVRWIFPDAALEGSSYGGNRRAFFRQSQFNGMRYIDLLASMDLVITKTGYGTQTEAVLNRVPSICIERLDWPEHSNLRQWHEDNGEVGFLAFEDMDRTLFSDLVMDLLGRQWTKDPIAATGPQEAARVLREYL